MKFRQNEEAVSPVIGVILMVAITVILAAVIAAFVFGMGTPVATPQASIIGKGVNGSTAYINLTSNGGDTLIGSDIQIRVSNKAGATSLTATTSDFMSTTLAGTSTKFGWTATATLAPGNTLSLSTNVSQTAIISGSSVVNVKLFHVPSGRFIADIDVTIT